MNKQTFIFFLSLLIFAPFQSFAQTDAGWLRTRIANALNPKISVIGDMTYTTGPQETTDRFSFRETEVSVQSEVDPYTRADFFFALHDGESFELEEGYITLLALPFRFQGRGGKFLANFSRLNMIHTHELPQADRPLVLDSYLGDEGLNDTGVEISRVSAPFNIFTEISYGILNGLGEEHHGEETVTTTVTDTNGNTVTVPVSVDEEEASSGSIRDFAHVARLRFFKDVTDNAGMELGFSGALYQPRTGEKRRMGGADLTLRWKPVGAPQNQGFVWRSEAIFSNRDLEEETNPLTGAVTELAATVESFGGYSYLEVQPLKRWAFGFRGDYVEDPEERDELKLTRAGTPYVTHYLNEFNRIRAQYQYKDGHGLEPQHIGTLQWTVIIGPHGAHDY